MQPFSSNRFELLAFLSWRGRRGEGVLRSPSSPLGESRLVRTPMAAVLCAEDCWRGGASRGGASNRGASSGGHFHGGTGTWRPSRGRLDAPAGRLDAPGVLAAGVVEGVVGGGGVPRAVPGALVGVLSVAVVRVGDHAPVHHSTVVVSAQMLGTGAAQHSSTSHHGSHTR